MTTPARIGVPVTAVWRTPEAAASADKAITRTLPDAAEWVGSLGDTARLALEPRLDSHALLGEPVLVIREEDGWAEVRLPWQPSSRALDGYPGWIPSPHLLPGPSDLGGPGDGVVVTARTAEAVAEDGEHLLLSFGTVLATVGSEAWNVRHPDGRVLRLNPTQAGRPEDQRDAGPLESAFRFAGLPYLWGGLSGHGVDCSGLVHLCHRAAGRVVPRDAHDQSLVGTPVPDDEVRPGDSVCFENERGVHHIGLALDRSRLLHAPRTGKDVGIGSIREDYPGERHGFRRFADALN